MLGHANMSNEILRRIDETVKSQRVVLFMKGNRAFPKCGFSARVVDLLEQHEAEFATVDVLEDPELRASMKEYSNWPTFPQLFVDGTLVGGCDIVTQMDSEGELGPLLAGS